MGVEEQDVQQPDSGGKPDAVKSPTPEHGHKPSNPRVSTCSTDKDDGLSLCRRAAAIILHMLLGGLCSLTIIISLRFVFLRIQFGSMRYWAILFVSWFLVFGVWAS